MQTVALEACLDHLAAAERLLEEATDLAGLARLALVIDMLLRDNGLPDRTLSEAFETLAWPVLPAPVGARGLRRRTG